MPQAQTGKTKSMPKVVRVNADDDKAMMYRNLGNGKRLPFIVGLTTTLASGVAAYAGVVIASGVEYGDYKLCEGIFSALIAEDITVVSGVTTSGTVEHVGKYFIEKDVTNNIVTLKSTANSTADTTFDILVMLGVAAPFV